MGATLKGALQELRHYPSAILGLAVILALIAFSLYTLITIPYQEAITLWRGGAEIWYRLPRNAPPAWINYFRGKQLPNTIILHSAEGGAEKSVEPLSSGQRMIRLAYTFDFAADEFPTSLALYFYPRYQGKAPFASVIWITPDGREFQIGDFAVGQGTVFRFEQDERLRRRLRREIGDHPPEIALFMRPGSDLPAPLKGTYAMEIQAVAFEEDTDLDAEFIVYGKVYGVAGTDHLRRDLKIALMWGAPVALAFGLLAALGTTVTTMVIAAFGVWYSGWVDDLIQRITEVNLMLPLLPILIMVGTFYSRSIWVILGVTILLSIFGGGIKTYRAIFLQIRESPYVEAAQAYGAGDIRIVIRYLVPRIIPVIIPQLVTLIPSYVFLEASLALLGLGDPVLPTWGKVIQDAQNNGALYKGLYYWVLEPAGLLMITGLSFAMVGFALDRIFNPRLRGL
ncbi:MAG: ABC transporter permease [Anaerolineae bacterium]|nr:ABC transporter permease [Anaerolineae bacterium]MDW8100727.1 ABC transporter permease [Anaerolineae bacterium]